MNKTILITGATAGFGKAIAEKFASEGWNCIITGRRKDKLAELSDMLTKKKINTLPLCFDVQNKQAVKDNLSALPAEWQQIDVLVNNAGLALGRDSFENASEDDFDTMIDTNIKGLLYVSKTVVPYMINRKCGHIINIGSISAKEVYPGGSVYCATKHAVDAISQGQRMDLLPHGIKVTALHPGAAETEFSIVRFKGDNNKAGAAYQGYDPLQAEDIANIAFFCAGLPVHVCVNDIVVTCTAQANAFVLHKENLKI